MMATLLQDLRYGFRMLLKTPGFTAVAILALALGIGANTAIFSVVNAVLLRPLPLKDPDNLVWAQGADLKTGEQGGKISPPDFLDYREQNQVFERFSALQYMSFTLTGNAAEPERVVGARVSADFFETLGIAPFKGRSFLAEEEREGSNRVAVVSYGLWQRRFGADPNLVGKAVELSGQSALVVGIMPAGFQFPTEVEVWSPIAFGGKETTMRRTHFLDAVGRLKPGVTVEQAQADINAIGRRLEQQYPETNTDYGMGVTRLPEQIVGQMRRTLFVLLAAVGFVLLIACANVANLSLARGATRGKEIAIRVALGASRARVVRQLLTESVLLAIMGGVLGLLLAVWGVDMLVSLSPEDLPRVKEVTIDPRVLSFTLLISVVTGIVFGLAPALSVSRGDLNETLKEGGRATGAATGHNRMRSLLVVAEVALSLVLLVGAGLLIKSFLRLSQVETGFNATSVMTMRLALPQARYTEAPKRAAFYQQLLERTQALPGVESAGVISELPLSGQENDTYFQIEGRPPAAAGSSDRLANFRTASPDYFRAMGIPLVKGRFFNDGDREGTPRAVIISETFARYFFPNEDPLGKRLTIDVGEPYPAEIVGIVGNIRHSSLDTEPWREMYTNIAQQPRGSVNLVIRTRSDPAMITAAVKSEVQALDRDLPIYSPKTMEQRVAESAAAPRFRTLLLAIFAGLALVLAAVGIYGVISYTVTQRTHEIGIRMALGAQRRDILRLVVGRGIILTLIGVAIGLAGAFLMTRVMASLLFGVTATDPVTYTVVSLLLIAVALAACYIPARKAMKVDPMVALRYE